MDWLTPILSYAGDYAKPIVTIAYATFVLVGVLGWYKRYQKIQVKGAKPEPIELSENQLSPYTNLDPLLDFKWRNTEPLKFRTWKEKYHLTMSLENSTFNDLIQMDKNYLSRIILRRKILSEHPDIALHANDPIIAPALSELYTYLTGSYLPVRYPSMFRLTSLPSANSPTHLYNIVTKQPLPLTPPTNPIRTLELLGANLDEDFLILLPSDDGDGYMLQGYVVCFPAGFNPKEKFGLKLRDIHKPVPGYKEKLEVSMDRFFEKLEVGKIVKRHNWSLTTHSELYTPSGNHLYEGDEVQEEVIDIEKTHLRNERQVLWRLPKTKALVFTVKTYLTPIRNIKDEGFGEELATAIDGLKRGNVPEMHFYKKGTVWGEAVKSLLRS